MIEFLCPARPAHKQSSGPTLGQKVDYVFWPSMILGYFLAVLPSKRLISAGTNHLLMSQMAHMFAFRCWHRYLLISAYLEGHEEITTPHRLREIELDLLYFWEK